MGIINSSSYFILNKEKDKIVDSSDSQIIYLNRGNNYLLPSSNLDYYNKNGIFESNLIDWCKQFCKSDKNFLDIGSHTGTYAISLASYCKNVFTFEPQKMTYYAMCGSVALSNAHNITCYNVGLGSPSQKGQALLKIVSEDGGGSSLHASTFLREESIIIDTLDNYHLDNISFIKMDIEDNELFALQGSLQTLSRSNYPPILFESNYQNKDLFDFLNSINYRIIKINGYNNMFLASRD